MPVLIYLPPAYDSATTANFPVLYILHGLNGSRFDWQRWGLFDTATQLMATGQIPPMVIVSPDGGGNGYWMDHFNGGPRFGSYISKDLVTYVDKNFRTIANGQFRAIGGMSMGAQGALQLALNNPGEFSVVGAHSLALRTKQQAFDFFGDQQYFEKNDPVSIVAKNADRARGLQIWIDIGRGDPWFPAADSFNQLLDAKGIAHTWRVSQGGHDGVYCSSHVSDYLRFYGGAFAAKSASLTGSPY
jgi:S-formylglutathione hydrolase FrmB